MRKSLGILLLVLVAFATPSQAQSSEENTTDQAPDTAYAARQLSSRDPLIRQEGAEELARAAAKDKRKLLEGYRLQEKNQRVRLALDWALYRVGKTDTLFQLIRALDSSRFEQAQGYLNALDTPAPLYYFLEHTNGNTQVKLLQVLAKIGDAETLERLKPYNESFDPLIAEAAEQAAREIGERIGQAPGEMSTRPRRVENNTSP